MIEIKVNDFVRNKKVPHLISKVVLIENNYFYLENNYCHRIDDGCLELWEPKENEYCWFSYRKRNCHLAKFVNKENNFFNAIPLNEAHSLAYDECAPFFGDFPETLLKDKI